MLFAIHLLRKTSLYAINCQIAQKEPSIRLAKNKADHLYPMPYVYVNTTYIVL